MPAPWAPWLSGPQAPGVTLKLLPFCMLSWRWLDATYYLQQLIFPFSGG